jgi:protein-disulfide isomerase
MTANARAGTLALFGSLLPAVGGLLPSVILAVDYARPTPVFCAEGGGCDALKHTAVAVPLGVPLPLFGMAGFAALTVVALLPGRRARVAQAALAAVAGLAGLALALVQLGFGKLCVYCSVVDASGVLSAVAAAARLRLAPTLVASRSARTAAYATASCAALAAVAIPIVPALRVRTVPPVIRDEMAQAPRGVATVVDFVDFECPFCRMTHADLEPLLEQHRDRVRLVRRQVPLPIHSHAMAAARAACCGERLGRGDAMANALFTAPEDELTPEGCERIAQTLGLPVEAYRACVKDAATDALIAADKAEFHAAGGHALPTLWIGEQEIVGAQPKEALRKALEEALRRTGS